jgi:hypothetical protein
MAVKVTTEIKRILATQKRDETLGVERVLALLQEVQKEIVAELATSQVGSYSAFHLRGTLGSIEKHLADWQSAADRELGSGLADSWEAGKSLLPSAATAAEIHMVTPWISGHTLDALKEFTFGRIASVGGDAYNKIKGEVTMGILGQKTPQEVAANIAGNLQSPSIFKSIAERAEVITGTEMGRAFSMATQLSIEAAHETLPDLQYMWLHAGHPRMPRMLHLALHGQVRQVGKPFYQTPEGAKVMYPRDPKAPIKEVIRCGCIHVPYMDAWGDAKEFANDFDAQQQQANKPRRT